MPHPYFRELSQAEDVWETEHVLLLALKLVGFVALLQSQRPGVTILSEHDEPHVSVSASP